MADVELNKGVQILLERMGSNPDEFVPDVRGYYPSKWRDIILSVSMRINGGKDYKDQLPFLDDKEIKILWEKLRSLQGDLFTKQVMNILLQDAGASADADSKELSWYLQQRQGASLSNTLTISPTVNPMRTTIGELRYP